MESEIKKLPINLVQCFSGVQMQRRGIENSGLFDVTNVATCETDINAIISSAAIWDGLTEEMVETYDKYPTREEMAKELTEKRIGYDFVKDKEYDWYKKARGKSKDLEKVWLANHISKNVGDIARVQEFPKCGMLTFSFPCFTGETNVKTKQGLVQIKDIVPGVHTIFMNNKEYQIYNLFKNGIKNVFDLTFDDDFTVTCTYNHPFLVQRDFKTEWVDAINLMHDDKIVTTTGECRYVKSKTNSREEFVYDIQVQDIHMFPLENDIIVKNCTDISIAGHQKGFAEGETRSGLVWEVVRILKNMKNTVGLPNFLLMENVDALVNKKNIEQYLELNKVFKEELNYDCKWKVLNAKYCGVPQNRARVFAIYYQDKIDLSLYEFPKEFDNGLRLKDVLEDEVDECFYINNEKAQQLIDELILNGTLTEEDYEED